MKVLFRIKWENIISISMIITTILCWIAFIQIPDVYTLALSVIPTFMTLIILACYDSIVEARKVVLSLWQ